LARSCPKELAELSPLCPGSSDVNLLGDGEGIVDLDAEIPHGALDFGVTQQQLDGTQISQCSREPGGLMMLVLSG
jgi:hypothetical protein